jgi:hypothetical protein
MPTVSVLWRERGREPGTTEIPDLARALELAPILSTGDGVRRVHVQDGGRHIAAFARGRRIASALPDPATPEQQRAVADGKCRLAPQGCDGDLHTGGYCGAHYARVVRDGHPGDPVVRRRLRRVTRRPEPRTFRPCLAEVPGGCPHRAHADDLCKGHYTRKVSTGTAGTEPVRQGGHWDNPLSEEQMAEALERAGGDASLIGVTGAGEVVIAPRRAPRPPTGRSRGRPPAFTEETLGQARATLAEHPGITAAGAAALLGISVKTVRKYFPEFRPRS